MVKLLNYSTNKVENDSKKSSFQDIKEPFFITSREKRDQDEANAAADAKLEAKMQKQKAEKAEKEELSQAQNKEKIKKSQDAQIAAQAEAKMAAQLIVDKTTVLNNITNMKNNYLYLIDVDIGSINSILEDLKKQDSDIDTEYKNFINDITNKLQESKNTVERNNAIMDRQKNNYDHLNSEYTNIEQHREEAEKLDAIAKINTDLVSKTSDSNATLVRLYPLVIFILIMCLIYLIYSTYNKFMLTVYLHYS
jgi:hypothetical protein